MRLNRLFRPPAVVVATSLAVLGPVGVAHAHVTISPSTTAAGAHAILEVSVGHGCAGSPTRELTISIPEGINAVTPTRHPLWEVEKEVQAVDPPIDDGHGNQVVERVASITYTTDAPLPDGVRDVLELSVTVPDAVGETLVFPTVQRCEEGESAWTEVPPEGQDGHDLEHPAPAFTVTAAEPPGAAPGSARGADVSGAAGSSTSVRLALGAGLAGMVLGAAALLHRRRT